MDFHCLANHSGYRDFHNESAKKKKRKKVDEVNAATLAEGTNDDIAFLDTLIANVEGGLCI